MNNHKYNFTEIEKKWQAYWLENKTFATPNPGDTDFDHSKPKYYALDMFPYPSGAGLHVGHPLGFIATDIFARYKRMQGFNVLHTMGFDAFGLPAEQYAIEHGVHPRTSTQQNIDNIIRQLRALGLAHDEDRRIATIDTDYYRWTQWIFLQLFNSYFDPVTQKAKPISQLIHQLENETLYVNFNGEFVSATTPEITPIVGEPIGMRKWYEIDPEEQRQFIDSHRMAYLDEIDVNWCPELGTVLANEEITNNNRSDIGNHPVYKRPLRQWMLRITSYAQRLADDLDLVDWPESIKIMQRNWIGRSEGTLVDFALENFDDTISVFTTRPDTLFGSTYMVLAPEHELVNQITIDEYRNAVTEYQQQAAQQTDIDRLDMTKDKTGVFTGAYAINPVNDEKIPIWIADYVMMGYGTGAIMAVPAHDDRDYEFAKTFNLPIRDVVYTPVHSAIAAFAHRCDLEDAPDTILEQIINFVAACVTDLRTDYDTVFEIIHDRRTKADTQAAQPQNAATEAERRGVIADIWRETILEFARDDLHKLVKAARTGRIADYTGAAITEPGSNVNSQNSEISLNCLNTTDAKKNISDWLEQKSLGSFKIQYKLRDWIFSRQKYWGEPFPILRDQLGNPIAVPEDQLPVQLPPMPDFNSSHTSTDDINDVNDVTTPPRPPLGRADDSWRLVTINGTQYERELNTMPQWAGSCWYYLRYIDPHNDTTFADRDAQSYWMGDNGVDLYVGGVEHAVLHLLYARYWHKVLYDLGHVTTPEPFGKLFSQGYIQAYCYRDQRGIAVPADQVVDQDNNPATEVQDQSDRQFFYNNQPVTREYGKMGKSLKNAVSPDDTCNEYGCDTLRLYELYMGPLDASKPWNTRDIIGPHRFLQRFWRNIINEDTGELLITDSTPDKSLIRQLHKTIKRVTDDMERLNFNTAIAALIEFNNTLVKLNTIPRTVAEPFIQLIAPLAPHIAEELWQRLGHDTTIAYQPWPTYEEKYLIEDQIELVVQILGKVRSRITVPADADDTTIEAAALADKKIADLIKDKTIRKIIIVPHRLVNIVAN